MKKAQPTKKVHFEAQNDAPIDYSKRVQTPLWLEWCLAKPIKKH